MKNRATIATRGFAGLAPDQPPTWRTKDAEGVERMHVRGYASTFDRVDKHGEVIGADCWKDVPADGSGVRFIHGHNQEGQAIGIFRLFEVTEKGLYFEAEMLPTTLGRDLFIQLEAGALDTFSVGFVVKGRREVRAASLRQRGVLVPDHIEDDALVVEYTAAELLEVSTVLFPSNDGARTGVKKMPSKKQKSIKRPRALTALKDAGAVGSGVTWAYDDGEPGFGIVDEVFTDQEVVSDDGDTFEAVEGDPIYKIHVYETDDGELYYPTEPAVHVYAYRSQVSPAEFPIAEPPEEEPSELAAPQPTQASTKAKPAGTKPSPFDALFKRAGV